MEIDALQKRQLRAERESLIIRKTDDGYRVCSPLMPANQYIIVGIPDNPVCSCPDFQTHITDSEWRCKHIIAVQNHLLKKNGDAGNGGNGAAKPSDSAQSAPSEPSPAQPSSAANGVQMFIKRSVSPDGRVDALSVEFCIPISKQSADDVVLRAESILTIQSEIAADFLRRNGNGASQRKPNGAAAALPVASPGQMLGVAGMDTTRGRRLFINVLANGKTLKLFGTHKQLAEAVSGAGFAGIAAHLAEGLQLNLPCRVVTKPSRDGKYLDIDRLLPAQGE